MWGIYLLCGVLHSEQSLSFLSSRNSDSVVTWYIYAFSQFVVCLQISQVPFATCGPLGRASRDSNTSWQFCVCHLPSITLSLWFWYICKKCLNRFVDLLCSYKTQHSNNQKLFFLSVSIFFCKIVNDTIIAGIGLVFWSYSSKVYADEKCLGSRIRDDGTVGE